MIDSPPWTNLKYTKKILGGRLYLALERLKGRNLRKTDQRM